MRNDVSHMENQELEKVELLGLQANMPISPPYAAFFKIDFDVAQSQHHRQIPGRRRPPQRRPDTSQEFFDAERLDNIIISASIQKIDFFFFQMPHREYDDC